VQKKAWREDGRSVASPGLRRGGEELRNALEDYFENGWTLTEVLFTSLREERGFYEPAAHGLRHPLIFYYGHPAALAINKLRVAGVRGEALNGHLERLLETGVDEMRWDDVVDASKAPQWPSLEAVRDYRAAVREVVLSVVREHPALEASVDEPSREPVRWCLAMICDHERIHLETSSVLIRELPLEMVQRPAAWPADHASVTAPCSRSRRPSFFAVRGGAVELGKPRSAETYGWDNEFGSRAIAVADFESSRLVTNGQFLEFVESGGYGDPRWWDGPGWGWRTFRNAKWPHFWVPDGPAGLHEYRLRLPFAETPLPTELPAEVNAHEARAYARWLEARDADGRAYRLTTEAEHHCLRRADGVSTTLEGAAAAAEEDAASSAEFRDRGVNLNLAYGSPSAVDDATAGNVWQWCEDDFAALPGFEPHWLYDDFSTPCFDGEHTVIHGGSFVSTGNESSSFARFHFRPHFHQHAGFRLTRTSKDAPPPELTSYDPAPPFANGWRPKSYADLLLGGGGGEGSAKYETSAQLEAYLDLHFPSGLRDGPVAAFADRLDHALDFPTRCASLLAEHSPARGAFLDVGCAVGGASFAASRLGFDEVLGVDFSQRFVDAATSLAAGSHVGRVSLPEPRPDCRFLRGDATDPAFLTSLGTFDAVLAANLLCRLPDPREFLRALPGLVRPRTGAVLLASPYSFMTQYTPRHLWLDAPSLVAAMTDLGFSLVADADLPLLIKDHDRKYQYILSHGLLFRFDAPNE